jgi:DNA-binding Xre family transcriptional regulator
MPIRANLHLLLAQTNVERAKQREAPLSLRQLALEAGIAPSVVSTLAAGRTGRIDFDTIDRLLRYFNRYIVADAGDLLVWEPVPDERHPDTLAS